LTDNRKKRLYDNDDIINQSICSIIVEWSH